MSKFLHNLAIILALVAGGYRWSAKDDALGAIFLTLVAICAVLMAIKDETAPKVTSP